VGLAPPQERGDKVTDARVTTVSVDLVRGMHFEASGANNISVTVDSSREFGGEGLGMSPMQLLLVSLGSCTGMDVISILRKKRQDIASYRVEVAGTVADTYPHVYTDIAIRHMVSGRSVSDEAVKRAIELSESTYCSAYAMLRQAARMSTSYEVVEAIPAD
jgi:putative redox protein